MGNMLLLVVLIGVNAFFAAVEIALISTNKVDVVEKAKTSKKAKQLSVLLENPNQFLATIQIGITFAGFLASAFAAERFATPVVEILLDLGVALSFEALRTITVVVITLILSFLTLVFGELVPKRVAMAYSYKVSMIALVPLKVIATLFKPFVYLLTQTTETIIKLLSIKESSDDDTINERQIRLLVERSAKKGKILSNEKVLINNIFEFDDKQVTDIMTHRTNLVALDKDTPLDKVIQVIEKEKFSRIPVYDKSLDHIIGVLYARDVMSYLYHYNKSDFNLINVMRKPYYVVESKRIDVLLKELQQQQIHMAIIVDEFGGVEGIVTLEDIIEELVGEIFDEHDELVDSVHKISDGVYRVDGSASIFDVNRVLKTELPFGDYDTIGGLLFEKLGYIPSKNDKASIELNNIEFIVEKMKDKKIDTIIANKNQEHKE